MPSQRRKNLLTVSCSNAYKDSVYPQTADFTFYGGLYRGVNLISVPESHFDLDYFGGPGLTVTPKPCDGGALFEINSFLVNCDENFTVLYAIKDSDGREVAGGCSPTDAPSISLFVPDAKLWSIDNPYLYTVNVSLLRRNEIFDQVSARVGVRSFSCDPEKGFILNGVQTPLRGVSRHQDRLYKGNALTKEEHCEDARLIKELGTNTIRLAHYQHSQDFYDACDELGFVVWAEIPFISVFNKDPGAHENCITQLTELIVQNYNHPSICFWGISNEILIGGISEKLVENHRELNALAKRLDPTRLTTIAHLSMTPTESPMHHITGVISWNHYFGWYGGRTEDIAPWMDKFHREHPTLCVGLSEYGCEGVLTYHSKSPICKDYSEEYQALYHEKMAKFIDERPWIWASHVWNMFDFGCAARSEGGTAGRNNKGLMTIDRMVKKDSFYIYQAYWTKEPMVHICGRRYAQRAGERTQVRVYSNQPSVALYLNGKQVEKLHGDKVFVFTVALKDGNNILVAEAGQARDSISLEKVENEPAIYALPGVHDNADGVKNWFSSVGEMDLSGPMEFPEGKYSVKDSIEAVAENSEAIAIVASALKLVTNIALEPRNGMWNMMKSMTVEGIVGMGGSLVPNGFLESLNAKLIQIDKTSPKD